MASHRGPGRGRAADQRPSRDRRSAKSGVIPRAVPGPGPASSAPVPTISRFFGIVIAMYYEDHAPPHFHARYGEQHAAVLIDPPGLIAGELSPRALGLVMEWARLHRADLIADWERARQGRALEPIAPLV